MTARASWDARIRRAEVLSTRFPASREILNFYCVIAKFQKDSHAYFTSRRAPIPPRTADGTIRGRIDPAILLPRFSPFLSVVVSNAPAPLADFTRGLISREDSWADLLRIYWENGCRFEPAADEHSAFCARAYLQPYAEYVAAQLPLPPHSTEGAQFCPACRGMPQAGVLRPEGDGARRALICSFCVQEWDYRRIVCPSCGEERESHICVYAAKEIEYIRLEACETCRTYIETIDATKDGHAIPIVDELACLPLSLWASEQGYRKLQKNFFGL